MWWQALNQIFKHKQLSSERQDHLRARLGSLLWSELDHRPMEGSTAGVVAALQKHGRTVLAITGGTFLTDEQAEVIKRENPEKTLRDYLGPFFAWIAADQEMENAQK